MKFIHYVLITLIWVFFALTELFLLSAGLMSQGHDKGRLIPIALAVIIAPAIAYGLHRLVHKITGGGAVK